MGGTTRLPPLSHLRQIGPVPVQVYRERDGVYLRGFPFYVGFEDGEPRVILNRIPTRVEPNLNYVYANEWTRPWVSATILRGTGFDLSQTTLVTMKARKPDKAGQDAVPRYLSDTAYKTVEELMDYRAENDLPPERTVKPELPHEPDYVLTEILGYDKDYSLYDRLGWGLSLPEAIEIFTGEREPDTRVTPNKGKSLNVLLHGEP